MNAKDVIVRSVNKILDEHAEDSSGTKALRIVLPAKVEQALSPPNSSAGNQISASDFGLTGAEVLLAVNIVNGVLKAVQKIRELLAKAASTPAPVASLEQKVNALRAGLKAENVDDATVEKIVASHGKEIVVAAST